MENTQLIQEANLQQPIRSQADQAANALQFGSPVAIYQQVFSPSEKRSIYGLIIMYIILVMFFPSYSLIEALSTHMASIAIIVCIIFFVSFSLFTLIFAPILFFRSATPWYVLLYPEGFISAQGRKITTGRWGQVLAIQQKLLLKLAFPGTRSILQYTLHMADNRQLAFIDTFLNLETANLLHLRDRDLPGFNLIRRQEAEVVSRSARFEAAWKQKTELIHVMEREVVTRLLPEVVATYQARLPVTFGQLQISIEGISDGEMMLPWHGLDHITLHHALASLPLNGEADDSQADTVPYADSQTLLERLEWWQNNIIPQHAMLIIGKEKGSACWSLAVSEIPNAFLLMELADYALRQQIHEE
jgi:hypothetical protein